MPKRPMSVGWAFWFVIVSEKRVRSGALFEPMVQ